MSLAVAQMCSGPEPEANLETIARLAREAAAGGAAYLLTPEMSVAFAGDRAELERAALPFEGNPHVAFLAEIARQEGIFLHIGSMAVAAGEGLFANRSVLLGPDGGTLAAYDKIHLFDADVPGDRAYRESATYRGGTRAVAVDTPLFRLGLTICYDLRFPALYRALAEAGAEVLSVPAAFTVPTGEAHWEVLLRARAIETGCFVLAAAQGGRHANGRATWGRSMIVDPWGTVIAAAADDAPGVIFAALELDAVGRARQRVPSLANGRAFSPSINLKAAQ